MPTTWRDWAWIVAGNLAYLAWTRLQPKPDKATSREVNFAAIKGAGATMEAAGWVPMRFEWADENYPALEMLKPETHESWTLAVSAPC